MGNFINLDDKKPQQQQQLEEEEEEEEEGMDNDMEEKNLFSLVNLCFLVLWLQLAMSLILLEVEVRATNCLFFLQCLAPINLVRLCSCNTCPSTRKLLLATSLAFHLAVLQLSMALLLLGEEQEELKLSYNSIGVILVCTCILQGSRHVQSSSSRTEAADEAAQKEKNLFDMRIGAASTFVWIFLVMLSCYFLADRRSCSTDHVGRVSFNMQFSESAAINDYQDSFANQTQSESLSNITKVPKEEEPQGGIIGGRNHWPGHFSEGRTCSDCESISLCRISRKVCSFHSCGDDLLPSEKDELSKKISELQENRAALLAAAKQCIASQNHDRAKEEVVKPSISQPQVNSDEAKQAEGEATTEPPNVS
eukprot:754583-Hanusia_phi.AAC.3